MSQLTAVFHRVRTWDLSAFYFLLSPYAHYGNLFIKHGPDKICYNGFIYRKDKATLSTITWRCEVANCKGRLKTVLDYRYRNIDPPRCILQDAVVGVSDEVASRIGTGTNLKRTVLRKRKTKGGHSLAPQTAADSVIPESHRITFSKEDFVLYDSEVGDSYRLIIFGTNQSLR